METKYKNPKTLYKNLEELTLERENLRELIYILKEAKIEDPKSLQKAYNYIKQNEEKLKKKYEKRVDPKDYYSFQDTSELGNFLKGIDVFDKKIIEEGMKSLGDRISRAKKLGVNKISLGCWLAKSNNGTINYVTNVGFKFNNYLEFFSMYDELKKD